MLATARGTEYRMNDLVIGRTPSGRRSFPISFRIAFIRRWDQCLRHGEKIQLMREFQLDHSTVTRWLNARDRGQLTASMVAAGEGSKKRMDGRDRAEIARLQQENEALKRKVAQAEAAQAILGKAFELLEGITTSSNPDTPQIPSALMSADEYAQWLKKNRLS